MAPSSNHPEYLSTRKALQEYILSLPLAERVRVAAMLSDGNLRGWLTSVADDATYELTTRGTYSEVARILGVSKGMVNRRVSRHNQRQHSE